MNTMTPAMKVLYTGSTVVTGGRDGVARSSDDHLNVRLSPLGTGSGTNPEQLFAAGWSACFIGAIGHAARRMQRPVPKDISVNAEVDLVQTGDAFSLQARLNVSMPGEDRDVGLALIEAAHQTCPYSKATRGNIDVRINLV